MNFLPGYYPRYSPSQSEYRVPNMGTWGYIIAYCYADSTYLKDAQKYVTKESKKSLTEPTKCVNCREAHPANATLCKEYVTRLELITSRNVYTA
ncbi:hypothetical protein HZH66_002578 [Vespula vulgaris]|uniref:Uncharacterized protein n=1 Tax=Vespula vulgaris TaxID=7454 RepID=A0A834KLE4_VESVU|nr:hypothetical protein HZH66_002578 [Vespula vulgaris]